MLAGFASPLAATADDDVPQHSRLLEKRRQVYEVEEALSAQKEEFARREAAFARREEALRRKDLELQETLVRFNQTIAENETKRVRAEKKALEDRGAATAKEDELYACLSQLAGLKEELSLLQTEKAKLSKYHRFLDAFQREHGEEYADIDGVLERFGTLRTAHRDLLSDQQRSSREIEEQRRNVARLQKASAMQAINHENLSARLSRHLEDTRALVSSLQSGADEAAVRRGLRLMELGQVLQSVYNLHSRCTGCAHGEVLRHTPADGEALGLGRGAFAEPDAPAAEDGPSGGGGAGGAGGSGGSAAPAASPGGSRGSRPSSAMPRDRDGSGGAAGGGGGGGGGGGDAGAGAGAAVSVDDDDEDGAPPPHAATPAAPSTKQLAAEAADVRQLRARLRTAVGLLHVAGSYVVDLSAMVAEYGQWREARREEEARREAVAAEESKRLAAARAARAGGAAGGKASAGGGGAGGPGSPGRTGAGRGAAAAAPAAPALPPGSGMRLAASGYGAGISIGSPGGKGMGTSMGMTMTTTGGGAGGVGGAHGPAGTGASAGGGGGGFTSGPIVDKRGTKTWVVRGAQLPSTMAAKLAAVGGRTAAEAADKAAESASPAGGSSLNSSTIGKR